MLAMPIWADGNDAVNNMIDRGACSRIEKGANATEIYEAMAEVGRGKIFVISEQL